MKHVRLALFALALTLSAAACSADVTGPSSTVPAQNLDSGAYGGSGI